MHTNFLRGCAAVSLLFDTAAAAGLLPRQASPPATSTTASTTTLPVPTQSPANSSKFETNMDSRPTTFLGSYAFSLSDQMTGTPAGARGCFVMLEDYTRGESGLEPFGCGSGRFNTYAPLDSNGNPCVAMNGRHTVDMGCGGLLTVEFPKDIVGNTYFHYTWPNGTYTGCTADSKKGGSSCVNDQQGTGSFGSKDYVGNWCVASIVQHQKAHPKLPPTDTGAQYSYNVTIYDNGVGSTAANSKNGRTLIAQTEVGDHYGQAGVAMPVVFSSSVFKGAFTITSGNIDKDPYTISYDDPYTLGNLQVPGKQTWSAYDTSHQCDLANFSPKGGKGGSWGYYGDKRVNNCGFYC